ncbi:MAG TPA: kelch repeat-containing protein, partial [Polyangiaceae bacterium]|nr:kelch repeat-containing protein [Polyangiaceae bacterium]
MRLIRIHWLVAVSALWGCGESTAGSAAMAGSPNGAAAEAGSHNNASGGVSGGGATSAGGVSQAGSAVHDAGVDPGGGAAGTANDVQLPDGVGWMELSNTSLDAVCACNDGTPEVCANSGCGGIFAWSSGAYDASRQRLLVFGGGHSDYFGNEIFALSLSDFTMTRLTEPGLPLTDDCSGVIADGTQPSSRHTYDALVYVQHADRLFVFGGSKTPCGYLADDTWTYSFADRAWERRNPTGPIPHAVPGVVADYDPQTQKVFIHDDTSLYSYDIDNDSYELLAEGDSIDYHMTAVIEPNQRKFVIVGAGSVLSYDIDDGSQYARVALTTTGADELVASGYPGLAYDPSSGGRIVAWNGGVSAY